MAYMEGTFDVEGLIEFYDTYRHVRRALGKWEVMRDITQKKKIGQAFARVLFDDVSEATGLAQGR